MTSTAESRGRATRVGRNLARAAVGISLVMVAMLLPYEAGTAQSPPPPPGQTGLPPGGGGGSSTNSLTANAAGGPGMVLMVDEVGRVDMSLDALPDDGDFTVEKPPINVIVRRAFVFAATQGFYQGSKSSISLNGQTVPLGHAVSSNISSTNYWSEVTSIVKPLVEGTMQTSISIPYVEGASHDTSSSLDGAILAVIYELPSGGTRSIGFMYGGLQTDGDSFQLALDSPFDPGTDTLDMSLGISYSCGYCSAQYSNVDVNGERLSSAAGGADDGYDDNGALITVGGIGDSTANPTDPYAPRDTSGLSADDDELYDLSGFVEPGATSVTVTTDNPSDNDNIFFAAFRSDPPVTGVQTGANLSGFSQGSPYAGDPVDAASGNFIDTTTDLVGPEGTSLALSRTYNSFDTRTGIFGRGWSTLFDASVVTTADDKAAVRLHDGRTALFTPTGTGTWTPPDRLDAELTGSAGSYVLRWDDGREWTFGADDRIVKATTPDGEEITISRSLDQVYSATSKVGGTTRFTLTFDSVTVSSVPVVTTVTTNDGRSIDVLPVEGVTAGNPPLTARVGSVRPSSSAAWSTGWWQYTYDTADRLSRMEHTVDATANPSSTTVRTRLKVANTYDASGRVSVQVNPEGTTTTFSYGNGTTTVTDGASGDATTYLSDDDGRMVGVTDAANAGLSQEWGTNGKIVTETNRAGATSRTLHDAQGRARARLLPDPTTGAAQTPGAGQDWTNIASWGTRYETWEYATSLGASDPRVTRHRDASGAVMAWTYTGSSSQPATHTIAFGTTLAATTTFTYIPSGPAKGQVDVVTSPTGIVTDHAYDPATGEISSISTGGRVTTFDTILKSDSGWQAAWTTAEPTAVRAVVTVGPGTNPVIERQFTTLYRSDDQPLREIDPYTAVGATGYQPIRQTYDDLGQSSGSINQVGGTTTTSDRYVTDRLVPRNPATPCGCTSDPAWTEPATIGRMQVTTDPDGVVTTNRYSQNGDLVEERVSQGAAAPTVIRHTYGALGRETRQEVDAGTVATPLTEVTTFGYGPNGERTQVTQGGTLGVATRTATTEYDKLGRVTAVLGPTGDPKRQHTTYTYDALDRVVARLDAASDAAAKVMTTFRYDAAGRLVERVVFKDGYADTAIPYPALSAHPDATVTRFSFNGDGRAVTTVEAPPNVETYAWPASETGAQLDALPTTDPRRITRNAYDAVTGDLLSTTNPDRSKLTMTYDSNGRVRERVETAAPPTSGSPATRLVGRYDYDPFGRVLHQTSNTVSAAGTVGEVVKDFGYSPLGGITSETDPHLPSAPAGDIATRLTYYTAAGRVSETRDALGTRTTYTYLKGLRTKSEMWNAAGTTVVSEVDYAYTRNGRPASETVPHAPSITSPPLDSITYDDRGRESLVVDASGRRRGTTYTNSGQPATTTWKTNFSDPTLTTATNGYDGAGRRTSSTGTHGSYTWTFDRLGQLTAQTRPGATASVQDQYRWDLAGNRVWTRSPNGRRIRYSWDSMGQMTQVALDIAAEPNPPSWFAIGTYGRSGFGDLTRETLSIFSAGGQRTWTRNLMGQVSAYAQSVTPTGHPATTTSTTMTYRPDGRLATEATAGQPSWQYGYDRAGELTSATPSSGTALAWTYGRAGERTSSTDASGTTTYAWNPGSRRLGSMTTPTGTRSFTYDSSGRRATETSTPSGGTATTRTFAFDDRGQLASISEPGLTLARTYDVDGRLTGFDSGDPKGPGRLGWDPVPAIDTVTELSVGGVDLSYDFGVTRVRGEQAGGSAVYFAYDAHGSTIDTAMTEEPTSYDPYGNPDQDYDLSFGYRSELTLLGYVHLRARDYDPTTGTFLSRDPLAPVDGSPAGNNPYHYVDNDPLNKVDPLGLRPCDQLNCFGPAPTDYVRYISCDKVNNDFLTPPSQSQASLAGAVSGKMWDCYYHRFDNAADADLFNKGVFSSGDIAASQRYLGFVSFTKSTGSGDSDTSWAQPSEWHFDSSESRLVQQQAEGGSSSQPRGSFNTVQAAVGFFGLLSANESYAGTQARATRYYQQGYVYDARQMGPPSPHISPAIQRLAGYTGAVGVRWRRPAAAECIDWKLIKGFLPVQWTGDVYDCLDVPRPPRVYGDPGGGAGGGFLLPPYLTDG